MGTSEIDELSYGNMGDDGGSSESIETYFAFARDMMYMGCLSAGFSASPRTTATKCVRCGDSCWLQYMDRVYQ